MVTWKAFLKVFAVSQCFEEVYEDMSARQRARCSLDKSHMSLASHKFPAVALEHRTERYKKSFHYSALKEWNNTPRDIRELPTINTFKRQLKVYMKSKT